MTGLHDDQKKPTRIERALAAWTASCARRDPPEDPHNRVMEALMGQRSITGEDGTRRFVTLDDQLEHLRVWTVFEAALHHPLLEAFTAFSILKDERGRIYLRLRVLVPFARGHRPEFASALRIERREVMDEPHWFGCAQMAVRGWLKETEFQMAEELVHTHA